MQHRHLTHTGSGAGDASATYVHRAGRIRNGGCSVVLLFAHRDYLRHAAVIPELLTEKL